MITLTKNGNAIVFTFEDNAHYLFDGTIEVPVNSLTLITDNSQMATFKKSASNDVFISATYAELGMSKADLESWFKENACGSTGGGGGGVTSGEVETMIEASLEDYYDIDEVDTALANKADTSAVTAVANDVSTVSGQVATKVATSDFNTYSAATDARIAEDEEVTAAALNDLNDRIGSGVLVINLDDLTNNMTDEKWDELVDALENDIPIFSVIDASGEDTTDIQQFPVNGALIIDENEGTSEITLNQLFGGGYYEIYIQKNGSEDYTITNDWHFVPNELSAGTGIDITDNVISCTVSGGGATYSAGTNISIANDTINCTLPITANTSNLTIGSNSFVTDINYGSIALGRNSQANAYRSLAGGEGSNVSLTATNGFAWGIAANVNINRNAAGAASIGYYTKSTIQNAFSIGRYNSIADANTGENFGSSGNTLFAVGNGTAENARHNALEVRQNGDIYVNDGTNDVRLQDTILALGGLKFVKLTQAEYDQLATKDANTLYIISNVVS